METVVHLNFPQIQFQEIKGFNKMIYKLISTYELLLSLGAIVKPVRIEIFVSPDNNKFRARIWVKNTYNLYPTLMNINEKGDDLHTIHSSDDLNQEITSLILDNDGLITGQEFESENEVIQYVKGLIGSFTEAINGVIYGPPHNARKK